MEQIDSAANLFVYDTMNRLTAQTAGGPVRFAGTVSEPAFVTIQSTPALVSPDNRFEAEVPLVTGTNQVVIMARDLAGNETQQPYAVPVSGEARQFEYDRNGNMTSDGTRTFEWDAENRLARVLDGGDEVARFRYDGNGRRAQKTTGALNRFYVYDGQDVLEERLSGGEFLRHTKNPALDLHLGTLNSAGTATYYTSDHLGTVVQVTNAAGDPTQSREYDPFGKPLTEAGQDGYAFTGQEWDSASNLYYFRARYYDPFLGRFLTEDPVELVSRPHRELNPYSYVANNPINEIDPTGEGIVNCTKKLAELTVAIAQLTKRIAELEEFGSRDPSTIKGHPKSIEQLQRRVNRLYNELLKHCKDIKPPRIPVIPGGGCFLFMVNPCEIAPEFCCNGVFIGRPCDALVI